MFESKKNEVLYSVNKNRHVNKVNVVILLQIQHILLGEIFEARFDLTLLIK